MTSLKTTNKGTKFEMLKPFSFLFALAHENIFIRMHNIQIRFVTGPENILCGGVCMNFSAQKFSGWGSEGVKMALITDHLNAGDILVLTVHG